MGLWNLQLKQFVNVMVNAEDLWIEVVDTNNPNKGKFFPKQLKNKTSVRLDNAVYKSQGVDMPEEQIIKNRTRKDEWEEWDSGYSDSDEEDSDYGDWELDSEGASLEEAGTSQN